jgi:hypothetical protein
MMPISEENVGEGFQLSEAHAVQAEYVDARLFIQKGRAVFSSRSDQFECKFELEALGNAFMVKAVELDIKLSGPKATALPRPCTDASTTDKLLSNGRKYQIARPRTGKR